MDSELENLVKQAVFITAWSKLPDKLKKEISELKNDEMDEWFKFNGQQYEAEVVDAVVTVINILKEYNREE